MRTLNQEAAIQRVEKAFKKSCSTKKHGCGDIDCKGWPGCSCVKNESWKRQGDDHLKEHHKDIFSALLAIGADGAQLTLIDFAIANKFISLTMKNPETNARYEHLITTIKPQD